MPARKKLAKRLITAEDLRALRTVGSPAISPDGRQVVYVVKHVGDDNAYHTQLWIADADTGVARPFTSGERDSQPVWSPDGLLLAFVRATQKGRPQIALIASDGGEARSLDTFPEGSLHSLRWSPTGLELFVCFRETAAEWTAAAVEERKAKGLSDPPRVIDDPHYRFDGDGYFDAQRYHLMRVDPIDGSARSVWSKDRLGFFSYDVSPDGRRVALCTDRDKLAVARGWTRELLLLDLASGKTTPQPDVPPGFKTGARFSPDGKLLAWAGVIDEDGTHDAANLELFVAETGKGKTRSLTARHDVCLAAPTLTDSGEVDFEPAFRWHTDGKRLWMQIGWHGETHLATIATAGGPMCFHTEGKRQVRWGSLSADGKRIAVTVETATRPGEVHVADVPRLSGRSPEVLFDTRPLSDVNGALFSGLSLSAPKASWVTSADGTKVHTWVMLPPGASPKRKRATVLEIHGGPQTQYGYSFFHEFQLLAANGYAVVYSNPRGSKGYGQAVTAGIHHAWGSKDWEDVHAVTEWMAGQPFCDAARMGVMGGSFGGYMTLWAIGHSKAYKAAIADRCVSNMVAMWGSSDVYIWPDGFFPGNTWSETEALWDMSPLKYLGNVKTPTLLIHSEGDLRCNVAESEQVHAALTIRGVPVRFVRYPRNTSHGMSRGGPPDMRIHRVNQIVAWWKRWLS